jgi:hypothetical protein
MEVSYKNKYGQQEEEEKYPVVLKRGDNEIELPISKLPGGYHISDYRLMDKKGLIYDFGGYSFNTPGTSEIKEIKFPHSNPCYEAGEDIRVEVELNGIQEGTLLNWYVEDTYNRISKQGSQILKKGQSKTSINFRIDTSLSILHRLFVKLESRGELLNLEMREFSMPYHFPPSDELLGYGWISVNSAHGFKLWKEKGLDLALGSYTPYRRGFFKALLNANMRLGFYGLLYNSGDVDKGDRYRGDLGKEGDDVIRKPCYSDLSWWAEIEEVTREQLQDNKIAYYGIRDYPIGDECFIGSNVCYSEYCLKDFREYLKKEYRDLKELNLSWVTGFKSWEEVVPIQLKEVNRDKNNIAAWLDHKMFMTSVFARLVERMKKIIEDINSDEGVRVVK